MENNTKHTQDEKINLSDLKIFHFQATAKKWIWKVTAPESDLIADTYDKEHAEFIVKACNNYDKLKENNALLLENLIRLVDRMEENEMGQMSAVRRAKEAIEKTQSK